MLNPRPRLLALLLSSTLSCLHAQAWADSQTFSIKRFNINGNSLLSTERLDQLTAPYTGEQRSFADVQLCLEELERAYRELGYSAVAVNLPEQEISAGEIRFDVIEARFGKIRVQGAKYFSEKNILRSLPHIKSGEMPHAVAMSQDVGRANENPAKKAEVVLKISDLPGEIDADIQIEDENPSRGIVTLDNTGMGSSTGNWRLGLSYQHANLFDRDHVLTLQYTTALGYLSDVTLFNIGYHIPYYRMGDSLDFYAGYSNVDAGTIQAGSIDSFVGQGHVAGLRYNHNFVRRGEYEHGLALGLDWKAFDNSCGGVACGVIGADVTASPLSLNYRGTWTRPGVQTLVNLSYAHNIPMGMNSDKADYLAATHQPGTLGTEVSFDAIRFGVSQLNVFDKGWQTRASLTGQHTDDPLIQGEQFGLVGANQIRGFNERAVARDIGYLTNLELYTPDFGKLISGSSLRGLVFYDYGQGWYVRNAGENRATETVASVGLGLRFSYKKNLSLKLDVANVRNAAAGQNREGDWKAHVQVTGVF